MFFAVKTSDIEDDKLHDDAKVAEKHTALHSALLQFADDFVWENMMFLQKCSHTRVKSVISTGSLKLDLALGIGELPKVTSPTHMHNYVGIQVFVAVL